MSPSPNVGGLSMIRRKAPMTSVRAEVLGALKDGVVAIYPDISRPAYFFILLRNNESSTRKWRFC
jgi:hypothetical protein